MYHPESVFNNKGLIDPAAGVGDRSNHRYGGGELTCVPDVRGGFEEKGLKG